MRNQTRSYTDNYPVLDLTSLHKKGFIDHGKRGESTAKARGRVLWSFSWLCMDNAIEVHYTLTKGVKGDNFTHSIPLVKQSVNFGGERLYLICSHCYAQRKQIYLKGGKAACRKCHGLYYQSQSESTQDRKYRKLDRLLSKVHNLGYRFDGHCKAKGQHRLTFQKLDLEINNSQQSIFNDINRCFGLRLDSSVF